MKLSTYFKYANKLQPESSYEEISYKKNDYIGDIINGLKKEEGEFDYVKKHYSMLLRVFITKPFVFRKRAKEDKNTGIVMTVIKI